MILVAITALLAVCNADKLDRTYLPPSSAQTAGGSPGAIQAPFPSIKAQGNQGLGGLPQGGFENEYDGVVVDAASTGSRTNGATGLGAPRKNYGSTHSKVGEAAFKETHVNQGQAGISQRQPSQGFTGQQGAQIGQDQGFGSQASLQQGGQQTTQFGQLNQDFTGQSFQGAGNNQFDNIPGQFSNTPQKPERAQAASDRNANIIRYESDVNSDKFNYAFETDNGIVAEENAVNNNGIQAQGGFSYTGDDGQVYSVTYTADEGGYQPKGSHLPTPPPIPEEILKSLEKNAQDEAAGIIDDGSYNPQKYNVGSGYTQSEIDSGKYNGSPTNFGSRPGLNKPSESFANYEQPSKPLFGNNALASNSNPSYQFESTSGKFNQPSGNNFDLNNKYSPANNRFQNGKPGLNKAQVPSNTFDKLVENSSQGEDQGQDMSTKPESNNAPFGISEGGNRRPSFGNLNQNRPSTTFEQNAVGNNDQQRPFGRPQKTGSSQVGFSQTTPQPAQYSQSAAQDVSNVELNDSSGSQFNGQQIQGGFNQQKPSNFNDFSESVSSSNKEYLPPFNHIKQNGRPQAPNSGFQFSKPSFTSRPPSLPLQPSQHGFQQNSQIPGRFPSNFGQPSRFGSQSSNNGFDKAPTSPPDTMLTTPFESTNQYSTINSGLVPSDFSRVEVEAQKEQLTNLQPSPPLPQFASFFAANLQKYQTASQNTQQNNRKPTFGTNFNSFNQNSQPSTQFSTTSTTQEQKEQLANVPLSPSTPSSQFASSFAANLQKYQTSSQNTQQNNRQPSFGTNFNSFNQNRKPSAQFATTTEAQNEQVTNLQPFPIPSQFASSFAANAGKYQTAPQNTQQNNSQPSFGENFNSFNQNKQPSVQFETTTDSQKEQFTNLQPFPSTPSSQFASSFAANAGKYQSAPQNTQQNNRQPSFGTNFNSYNQNRQPSPQFATTTAKPLFDQPQYQGADDSYYYNQPSQAFNTPSNQNPDRFSNVQFNIPFDSNRENLQDAGLIHTTTVTYPRPPTVAPTVATSSSQKDLGLGPIPQTGSVTDATASSFTSDTSNSQGQASFSQRPSFGFSANRPLRPNTQQSFAQNSSEPETPQKGPSAFNQQYQGEIYEYKKPDTMLPAQPEKDNTDQTSDNFTGSTSQSQFPSSQNESGLNKPPCCKRPTGRPSVFPVTSDSENSEPTQDDKDKPEKLIQGFNPNNYQPSNTNFAGESFGGPRKPPSFDAQTGYHY